jgi:Lon protease-like protein
MSRSEEEPLGLFPLGLVLVPGEVVPLHIFEERYKLLINELGEGGEFGVVLAEDDGVRECGCTATVVQVLERMDDGRMNILVQGRRRFRLLEVREPDDPESEYLSGLVAYYDDEESTPPPVLIEGVLAAYLRMLRLMDVESPHEPGGEEPLSFRLAAAVDFGAPLKQELLEATSEEQRLETLLRVMESLVPRLKLRKQREEAIRGNGKGY